MEPTLEATTFYDPPNCTFPFGTHVCVVEVDRDTGEIELLRYVAVDDVGNVINPLIVDGQVHGGIAQGLAQALYEGAVYDDSGELITGTMNDYAIPRARMVPTYELDRTVTPSPVNPMGAKGAGEAGTIASTPAVANAVIDALAHLGVRHLDMPLTPEKLWRAMAPATG
jgi:carbon-monoxide dehydrogenase large subunit